MPQKSMRELQSLVGETRTTVEGLRVERGKIAEFATAIGDRNPVYHDQTVARERGFDTVPAPPTFVRTKLFDRHRPDDYSGDHNFELGFERGSQLHGHQSYRFDRPLVAGDVLSGETTLVDVYQRDGADGQLTFAEFETIYYDDTDKPVLTDQLTRIEVSGELFSDTPTRVETSPSGTRTRHDHWPYSDRYPIGAAEVEPGMTGPEVTVTDIEPRDLVVYAGASGDFNRMHYDLEYARSRGSAVLFAQGMLTAAYAARVVTTWFGSRSLAEFAIQFHQPVWVGDSVTATGEITAVATSESETTAELDIEVTTQQATTVATGGAEVSL
jgi:peroxisomal enoyl-CoA hydratase 2